MPARSRHGHRPPGVDMSRAAELRGRIANIDELQDVVSAMRSLAAARVQRADQALPAIRRYAEIVADAIARVQAMLASRSAGLAFDDLAPRVILVCSEHGFVGAYNERLVDRAAAEVQGGRARLWIVGTRGIPLVRARELADRMVAADGRPRGGGARHRTGASRRSSSAGWGAWRARPRGGPRCSSRHPVWRARCERQPLLPVGVATPSARPPRPPPLHYLPPAVLFARVIGEHVVAELVARTRWKSFASENASRFEAMEAARHNIDDRLRALRELAAGSARTKSRPSSST